MDEKVKLMNTSEIKSILKAILIYKIYKRIKNKINNKKDLSYFFFNSFNSIIDYINQFAKRDILEPYEIKWGYDKIHEFSLDFILYIPKFEKKDIFSLFLFDFQTTIPESEIQKGPLLDNPSIIQDLNNLKQDLKNLKKNIKYESKGFKDIFFEIIRKILKENNFKSDEDLEEFLKDNKYEDFYIFFLFMINCDKENKKNQLIWDDYKAITENWIENKVFMDNYPSFYYWLCKHYYYSQTIKDEMNKGLSKKFQNDSIPVFAIFLRIITSKNFVIYEPIEHKFSENLNKKILAKFIEKENVNLKFLINLTLDSVPPEIKDKKLRNLYEFISQIWKEKPLDNPLIEKIRFEKENDIFMNLFDIVFEDSFMDLFNLDRNSKEDSKMKRVLEFILEPNNIIKNEMEKKKINQKKNEIITDFKAIIQELENDKNEFFETSKKTRNEEEKQQLNLQKEEEIKEEKNQLISFLERYKNIKKIIKFDDLSKEQDNLENLRVILEKLEKYHKNYNLYFNYDNIITIKYLDFRIPNYQKRLFEFKSGSQVLARIKINSQKGYYYFDERKWKFNRILDQNTKKEIAKITYFLEIKEFKIYSVKDDYKEIFDNENKNNFSNQNKMNSDTENKKENELKNEFDFILHDLKHIFENSNQKEDWTKKIESIKEKLSSIYLNDISICPKNLLSLKNKIIKNLEKCLPILNKVSDILKNPKFKSNSLYYSKNYCANIEKSFWNHFLSFIPSILNYDKLDPNKLSQGYIKMDTQDNLNSNVEIIELNVNPIFLNLDYSDDIELEIPTFFTKKVNIDFEIINKNEKDLPNFKIDSDNKKFIKIIITPPLNLYLKNEEFKTVETKLKYDKSEIKCNFFFHYIPLSFLLFCDNYTMKYEKSNYILNVNYLFQDNDIIFHLLNYFKYPEYLFYFRTEIEIKDDNESSIRKINYTEAESYLENESYIIYKFSKNFTIKFIPEKKNSCYIIHLIIKIRITHSFVIPIEIKTHCIPLKYSLEVFDFNEKKYTNKDITIKMNKDQPIFNGKLYFKIIAFEKYEIKALHSEDACKFNLTESQKTWKKYIQVEFTIFKPEKEAFYSLIIVSENINIKIKVTFLPNEEGQELKFEKIKKNSNNEIKDIINYLNKNKITEQFSDLGNEAFLITQNNKPEIKTKNEEIKEIKGNDIIVKENKNLPILKELEKRIPNIDFPDIITLDTFDNFLSNCIEMTEFLPRYTNALFKENKKDLYKFEKLAAKLFLIYRVFPEDDNSIFSCQIKTFQNSFINIYNLFDKAGVEFKLNSFPLSFIKFEIPFKNQFGNKESNKDKEKENKNKNKIEDDSIIKTPIKIINPPEKQNKKGSNDKKEEKDINEKNKDNKSAAQKGNYGKSEKEKIDQGLLYGINSKKKVELKNEDDIDKDNNNDNNTNDNNIDNGLIDDNIEFRKIGIDKILAKIKNNKVLNNELEISEKLKPENIEKNDDNPSNEEKKFPIYEYYNYSKILATALIEKILKLNINNEKIYINILSDSSFFISEKNKIFNIYLICGLTIALNFLKIPYSLILIGDIYCIIKKFEEPHSINYLEKLLECTLIKRCRNKIPYSIKFTIDNMSIDKENMIIFMFTNGIEETLILKEEWNKTLLNNNKLSLGFFFSPPIDIIEKNDLELIQEIWDSFEKISTDESSYIKIGKFLNIEKIDKAHEEVINTVYKVFDKLQEKKENENEIKRIIEEPKEPKEPIEPIFEINDKDYNLKKLILLELEKSDFPKEIFIKKNNLSEQPNKGGIYEKIKNKLKRYSKCNIKVKERYINELFKNQNKIDKNDISSLEKIFEPNKATQKILSSSGLEIDINAFLLFLINPLSEPIIFLEEKGGLIRNYSVSVVIDTSISCLNELSLSHTIETLKVLLNGLYILDLPNFDLIVTGKKNPIVLCHDVKSSNALNKKEKLWKLLYIILNNPLEKSDLASAIYASFDIKRRMNPEKKKKIFVLTDGNFDFNERKLIQRYSSYSQYNEIEMIGIGIGIFPKGIENLFNKVVYSKNPNDLFKGIESLFTNNLTKEGEISFLHYLNKKDIIKFAEGISPSDYFFHNLIEKIRSIQYKNSDFRLGETSEEKIDAIEINKRSCYKENFLKGEKILIVQLWTYDMSKNESPFILPKYLLESYKQNNLCLKKAADYYGVNLKIVINYEDAINEITKKNSEKKGFCDYYSIWIICGPPFEILPKQDEGNEKKNNPHLISQFIDVLIQYWESGGGLFFLAEGGSLHYQLDLFLERAKFKNYGKIKFKIEDEHEGGGILTGSKDDIKRGFFSRNEEYFKLKKRPSICHNIYKLFEGITISYVKNEPDKIKPFFPFAIDNDDGITSLIYCGEDNYGDIIIDCGFTKCFINLESKGTYTYFQNIIGWMANAEKYSKYGIFSEKIERPKSFEYKIDKTKKWKFKQILEPKNMKTLFAIDCSGSVADQKLYHEELDKIMAEYYKNDDIIYMWNSVDSISDVGYIKVDIERIKEFNDTLEGDGGTESFLIAEIAKQEPEYRDHLLIVTDGEVDFDCIQKAQEILENTRIEFKYVTLFVIGNGDNLSVGAPFCRNCENIIFGINKDGERFSKANLLPDDINTLNEIDSISNYEEFFMKYKSLEKAIQAKMIGSEVDHKLKNNLNKLKKIIEDEFKDSERDSNDMQTFNEKWQILYNMSSGSLQNKFTLDNIAAVKIGSKNKY